MGGGAQAGGPYHAFRYAAGATDDIGARLPDGYGISFATSVNAAGTAVGSAKGCDICPTKAWIDGSAAVGGTRLLNDLIDPALAWDLREANGINASGQIAGTGALNGVIHAFRLTPISPVAPTLSSIAVTPANATIHPGGGQKFTARGTFSDGSSADVTGKVTWSSSDTSVATVSGTGRAHGVGPGTTTITATRGGVSGSASLTVVAVPTLSSITVVPATADIERGTSQKFRATGTYSDGSAADLTGSVAWASSDTSVATIVSGGRFKAVGLGTATISATSGAVSGTATITVHPKTR